MLLKRVLVCLVSQRLFCSVNGLSGAAGKNDIPWRQHVVQLERMQANYKLDPDSAWLKIPNESDQEFRFRVLVATMLSPVTKEKQNNEAVRNLVALVSPLPLLSSSLSNNSIEDIEKAIKMVTFHRNKAKYIKEACTRCIKEFNDDIPETLEALLTFKGVGPKVAHATLTVARGGTHGIIVDTHVHRVTNRLGWVDTWSATSNAPEKTRLQLQELLPRDKWASVDRLLVVHGQTVCNAKKPKCSVCVLSSSCKYYNDSSYMR